MAITSYKAVVGYYNSAGTPSITTAVTGQLSDGWIPIGAPILTDAYGQCTQMMAKTDATPVIATSAYTVVTAANPQPPDATWDAQGEPLWIDTATYLQAYTKGGAYIQGVVPVSRGGTGATTAAAARSNLGVPATTDVLLKNDNLASLTDRVAAWLNVRPTGSTPLAANPVNALDATTKQWVEALRSVNESWSVVNTSTTAPPAGTPVYGGAVKSEYKIGTTVTYQASLQAYGVIGQGAVNAGAAISNGTHNWFFNQAGGLNLPNSSAQLTSSRPDGALMVEAYLRPKDLVVQPLNSVGVSAAENNAMRMINYVNVGEGNFVNSVSGDWYSGSWTLGGVRSGSTLLDRAQLNVLNGGGASASYQFSSDGVARCQEWRNTSDERIKSDIARISNPLVKMRNLKGVSWTMETNGSTGFGFIAQDVEKDFPEAVSETKFSPVTLRDGTVLDDIKSVNTSGVAAALHHEAILALMDKVEALEAELTALKSGK